MRHGTVRWLSLGWLAALALGVVGYVMAVPSTRGLAAESPVAASPVGIKERDIVRVGQPWLRINTPGHSAAVQALAFGPDSRHLFTAGLDKVVQVWDLGALGSLTRTRDIRRASLRERTIRWQVARGPRGSIFSVACAPNDGLVAIGGYGAMGSTGEIMLVTPDGTLVKALEGHRQTVCSLAFTADGQHLVSADTDGECRIWQRTDWTSQVLRENDLKSYGAERAASIQRQPPLRPIVVVGNEQVILPVLNATATADKLQWQLERFSISTRQSAGKLAGSLAGLVTSMAVPPDLSRLAAADMAGNLYLWDLKTSSPPAELAKGSLVRSLAFSHDGAKLAVGGGASSTNGNSTLQFWDVAAKKLASSRQQPDHVMACAYSPDGKSFAYAGGGKNEVYIEQLGDTTKPPVALTGNSRKILKVAFAAEKPYERIAFGTVQRAGTFNDVADLDESFNPETGQLSGKQLIKPADWLPRNWMAGTWRLERSKDLLSLQLFEGMTPRCVVRLNAQTQGNIRSSCWIPNTEGKPVAIAVGTDVQNMVCVFRLTESGDAPLLRQFRGHQDFVTSVAVSRDLRLLASGSADGTIQFWPLDDYRQGAEISGRWGAEFKTDGDKLIVSKLNESGPLFRKGLRSGDTLTSIHFADTEERSVSTPGEILARLKDLPWFTQVQFKAIKTTGVPLEFQVLPAWPALANLFVSGDREWAFWAPDGYYDASINGHTLFGWQVNRGLHTLPQFYRADQFRRNLERPDVMHQLLASGSLEGAMRTAREKASVEADRVLPTQIASTPTISILSPKSGELIANRSAKVRAQVTLPSDGKVSQTRVFANGVAAGRHQLVSEKVDPASGAHELIYEWDAPLPNETKNLIQVFVLTEANTAAFERVLVEQPTLPAPHKPKLYLLAVGVNQYKDPEIEDLDYPVADAQAIVAAFKQASGGVYDVMPPLELTNEAVTRDGWSAAFGKLSDELKQEVRPDDLLVIFMAGHGEVDPRTQTYHYICQNAELGTLLEGKNSISWDDFRMLAELPCRKLALLDTCHSGAIQGVRQNHKAATREFQDNLVFTVAAAADNEASQERTEWQHGAFTKALLEGLAGAADQSGDSVVTLDEIAAYTAHRVPGLTDDDQHPTAAPAEVLPYISLPLTRGVVPDPPRAPAQGKSSQ